jgi:glycosyltransferase involved in cell wall biosynthesis
VKQQPDIIHTHLWIANLIGLSTARLAGVKKRIYTRHHASIHRQQYPGGLKWDKLNNRLATHIIAPSQNVEQLLIRLDRAKEKKIRLIYHGFAFSYFMEVKDQQVELLYKKYGLTGRMKPVIGVISRFTEWKGVQYIIPAFKQLLSEIPDAHLVMANAHGDYQEELRKLLVTLPPHSFTLIQFEEDLAALYRLFDVFVHVPVDEEAEAFGQTYIEPLIVGIPCIFTLSGIAPEIIKHGENAMVVDFRNSDQIYFNIKNLLSDPAVGLILKKNGQTSVRAFTIDRYLARLKNLYLE